MRKRTGILVAIVLLLLLFLVGFWPGSGPDETGTERAAREEKPPTAPPGPRVEPSPPPTVPEDVESPGTFSPPPSAPVTKEEPAGVDASEPQPADPGSVPPAVRRNPRDPPPPPPRAGPGKANRPPVGPTGHWAKFPPEIPSGRAALVVLVVDREGRPIPGADVLLGPPDVAGEAAVSYAHLRKLGKSDPEGRMTAEKLPEGSAALAGNLNGLLNGPRGLDARSAMTIVLEADRTAKATLRLPLSIAEMGTLRGIVRDAAGKPTSAQLDCGFFRARAGRDGRFEIALLPAGAHTVTVRAASHLPHESTMTIEAGGVTEIAIDLEYKESGTVSLRGMVRGPKGEPVPGARVYVIATSGTGRGTVRSAETETDGSFSMESLPERLYETEVRLQAGRSGYRTGNVVFADGLNSSSVEIRLPVRLVKLRLTVLDAMTGAPQTRCRFAARKSGADRNAAAFSTRGPAGTYEAWIESGTHDFLVETPDHEPHRATVEVPAGETFAYTARLRATGDPVATEISLTVVLTDAATGRPVPQAKIELLRPGRAAPEISFEGRREDGKFRMPATTGQWRLRVEAPDRAPEERTIRLHAEEPEKEIALVLR